MSEVISPLVFQLGVGGIGGFVVGYALKKLSKLILVLIGLFILALIYLGTQWDGLSHLVGSAGSAFNWLVGVISSAFRRQLHRRLSTGVETGLQP